MNSFEKFIKVKASGLSLHFPQTIVRSLAARWDLAAIRHGLIISIILFVNLLLVSPLLMPLLSEINPDDEAKYIQSGWVLLQGNLRDLAWSPLVALIYAPIHLFVGSSLDWFLIEAWAGRFILYICLWLSMLYLARQLKEYFSPYVLAGILFIFMPLFQILENQSDALFVSFSVLALAQLIRYQRTRYLKDIWLASLFIGLGGLVRVDTLPLAGFLAVVALALGWRHNSKIKILIAALAPAAAVLACFSAVSWITQGNPNLNVSGKSWDSFEMNQPVPAGSSLGPRQETQRLFGTEADNQGSVFRAALRNPAAFAQRILINTESVPSSYLNFFNKTQGPLLIFFAVWGIYFLIKKKSYSLLIILLVWPLHTAINLIFFTRHIIPQSYYLPVILGAIGIWGLCDPELKPGERLATGLGILLFFLVGWLGGKPAFLPGALLLAAVFSLNWLVWPQLKGYQHLRLIPLLLILSAGFILRAAYPFPNYPQLGTTEEEQAVHYLETQFQPGTKILVSSLRPAIASRMEGIYSVSDLSANGVSSEELWAWMQAHQIQAIYLDSRSPLRKDITERVLQDVGRYYVMGFTSENENVHVLLVRSSPAG